MWELDHKEGRALKNWCSQTVVLEDSWKSLGLQGDQTVNSKGNQPYSLEDCCWTWSSICCSQLFGKDPDAGKDWGQEEKGATEDEVVGWMASLTQWTWVWANSGRQWRIGKPGVLQSTGSQRVRQGWATELNWLKLSLMMNLVFVGKFTLHS